MSYLSRRSRPFPYSIVVDGVGLMLGATAVPTKNAPNPPMLTSTKAQDISAIQPPDYSYAGISPLGDRAQPYESLVLGMGMVVQEKWQDGRYFDAQCVDLSVWPWCKGPQVSTFTCPSVDATTDLRFFFELNGILYLAAGIYLWRRLAGDTWELAHTFPAPVINTVVFTSNFDGVQRAWVALQTGVAQYSSDGTAWTPMATFTALAFAVIGREFWWAEDTNRLRKLDTNADPTNEGNYTTAFYRVGDKSSPIVNLMVTAAGVLLVAKTDGLYTLDRAGDDHMLYPFLKFARDPSNGRAWGQFENDIYVAYGTSLVKIGADFSAVEIGPETLVNYDGAVRGKITAFGGVGMQFAYATIYNPDSLQSYVLKFGVFSPTETGSERVQAWHGSLTEPFSGTMRGVFVSSIGAPTGHTRTYFGYANGQIGWSVNACVPNPAACSQYRFHVGDSWVNLPIWTATFHVSTKSLRGFVVTGPVLDTNNYVTIDYNLGPPGGPWTELAEHFDKLEYEEVSLPTTTAAVLAAFRVHLHNAAATATPQVSAVAIEHALRPHRIMNVTLNILCSDGLVRRDGTPLRIGRKEIKRVVEAAVDNPGAVHCILPDETVQELSFTDYSVSQAFDEIGRQWRGSLTVKCTQWLKAS